MHPVVVAVVLKQSDTFAVTIKPSGTAVLVMKSPECVLTKPHGLQSVKRSATVFRVGLAFLA